MKTTHTPGPWHINGFAYHNTGSGATGRRLMAHSIDGKCDLYTVNAANNAICEIHNARHACDSHRANARLIAAAPDLLGLVEDAAMQLDRLSGQNLAVYARTFAVLAKAAIAKVRGDA